MRKDVYDHVEICQKKKCTETKGSIRSPAPMPSCPIPSEPWERIYVDTFELQTSENGFKFRLVASNHFPRYCSLNPMTDKKIETVDPVILGEIVTTFFTPNTIITHTGCEFNNKGLEELCRNFNIKKMIIHTYLPQSNGVLERLNR